VEEKEVKSKKTLKTFNLDSEIYKEFSDHCKEHGISMSKKVENFIKLEMEKIRPQQTRKKETKAEDHSFSKFC